MESRSKTVPELTDTRIFNFEQLGQYDSLFASVESRPIFSENSGIMIGYASFNLLNTLRKIYGRLTKTAIGRWQHKVYELKSRPCYYKFIEPETRIRKRHKLQRFFLIFETKSSQQLLTSLLGIKKYIKNLRKAKIQTVIYKIAEKMLNSKSDAFSTIKQIVFIKRCKKIHLKERIQWAVMQLKNSRGYGVKKAMKRWQKWLRNYINYAKVQIHTQIHKYKNFERTLVLKVFKAFSDSQAKKKCAVFYKWRNKAKSFNREKKEREENERRERKMKKDEERLNEFEKNVDEQKQGVIEKQVESLLYSLSIDAINGFLNL